MLLRILQFNERRQTYLQPVVIRDNISTTNHYFFLQSSHKQIYLEKISRVKTQKYFSTILVHCRGQREKEGLQFLVPHILLVDDGEDIGLETTMHDGTTWTNQSLVSESHHLYYYFVFSIRYSPLLMLGHKICKSSEFCSSLYGIEHQKKTVGQEAG